MFTSWESEIDRESRCCRWIISEVRITKIKELFIDAQWCFYAKFLETFIVKSKAPLKSLVFHYSPDFSEDVYLDTWKDIYIVYT